MKYFIPYTKTKKSDLETLIEHEGRMFTMELISNSIKKGEPVLKTIVEFIKITKKTICETNNPKQKLFYIASVKEAEKSFIILNLFSGDISFN